MNISQFVPEQLAIDFVAHFEALASSAAPIGLAIPGGRSPGKILQPFAKICPAHLLAKLHLFWVDERGVPLGHADRNDQSTLADWAKGGPLPAGVHPMPAEMESLPEACQQYERLLKHCGFASGLHLTLLGIGEDGHFASCFPHHLGLQEKRDVFYLTDSPKAPPCRLSFSIPYILKSQRIDVLVMGAEKGRVVERSRQQGPSAQWPISLLMKHRNINFHLDKEALQEISGFLCLGTKTLDK